MRLRTLLLALSIVATSASAGTVAELFWVRSVAVIDRSDQDHADELRDVLSRTLPGVVVVPADDADMVIEYRMTATSWQADFVRFNCQAARFGERSTRAIRGQCEGRVYVRINLGTMSSTLPADANAVEDFAAKLRDAFLTASP